MKTPKIKIPKKINFKALIDIHKWHLERLNPFILMTVGAVLLVVLAVLLFAGGAYRQENQATLERAQQSLSQVGGLVRDMRRVLKDQQVQELALMAAAEPDKLANLQQYVSGRIPELIEVELFDANLDTLRGADLGAYGYAVLDALLSARETGLASVQLHGKGKDAYLALAVRIGTEDSPDPPPAGTASP